MTSTPNRWRCERCGAEVAAAEWRHSLCPQCLIESTVDGGGPDPDDDDAALEPTTDLPAPAQRPGTPREIGGYRIRRVLGEGGMGIVYEAEQQHPRRPVALKVVRGGSFVSPEALKALDREAQVLARLRHPGIAVIYELGRTDEGQHFFAMELVRGKTLTHFLEDRPAPGASHAELEFRLALFRKIGDAVSYAHQRGVIHRDLKPSNIMVTMEAASATSTGRRGLAPEIKILDFGLGRITDTDVAAVTVATQAGQIQGTLAYMSPEQARGNPDEIDLRSDVYSLGMILFELLVGRLPYEVQGLPIHEAIRTICETPPRSLVKASGAGPARFDRDLQVIVQTALEKEPARRYQSVAALLADIDRFIAHQPIAARAPSTTYQLKKLVLRHKAACGVIVTVVALLALLAAAMTVQARRVARERDRANAASDKAHALADLLSETLKDPDPVFGLGGKVTVLEALDRAQKKLTTGIQQPEIEAEFLGTIGTVYENLGQLDNAINLLRRSLEIRKRVGDAASVAEGEYRLASALIDKGDYDEAHGLLDGARAVRRKILGPNDPAVVETTILLGNLHVARREYDEAEKFYREAIDEAAKGGHLDSGPVATARNNLGQLLDRLGRGKEAEAMLREALASRQRQFGADSLLVASTLNALAEFFRGQGRLREAAPLYQQSLEICRKRLPDGHPRLALGYNNLAEVFREQGRYTEAEPLYREALDIFERQLGHEHPFVGTVLLNIATIRLAQGKPVEAEILFRRSLAISEKSLQPESADIAETRAGLAASLCDQKRYGEAEPIFRRAIEDLERAGTGGQAVLPKALEDYAILLSRTGRAAQAREAEERARAIRAASR